MQNIQLSFYIDKPEGRNKKYFVYKGKEYAVDFDSLVLNSNYFFQNQEQYKHLEHIPLLNSENQEIDIPEESIIAFIKSCQNERCNINLSSVIALQYLSIKYEFAALTTITQKFISEHSADLLIETLEFKLQQASKETSENIKTSFDTEKEEEIISNNIGKYIENDKMLSLPIPVLHRIYEHYYSQNENKNENEQSKIIDFLFRILDKRGKEASILFSTIDFEKENIGVINRLLNEYSDCFDFNMINSKLAKTTSEISSVLNREREEYKQLFFMLKNELEIQKKELNEMKEQAKQREMEYEKERKEPIKIFNNELEAIKLRNLNEMKEIKSQFKEILDKQKEVISTESLKKYHNCILQIVDSDQFNELNEETQNYIITEIIENESEFMKNNNHNNQSETKDNLINHVLCCSRLYDALSIKDNEKSQATLYQPELEQKILFIKNNMKDLTINFEIMNYLNNKSVLKSFVIDFVQNYENITIEINYPSENFETIIATLYDVKKQFHVYSSKKEILIKVFDNKNHPLNIFTLKRTFLDIGETNIINLINFSHQLYASLDKNVYKSFTGQNLFTQISIPTTVASIGEHAFEKSSFRQIDISASVTAIESNSFREFKSLKHILLPPSLITIKHNGFYFCESLTQISIPPSVKTIEPYAFYGCASLTKVTFENPSSLESIENHVFYNCRSLTQITIPSSIKTIDSDSFSGCTSLIDLLFENPSSLASIEKSAFSNCKSLQEISFPPSLSKIGDLAFSNCYSLSYIEIPSPNTSIGVNAFANNLSLTRASINTSINVKNANFMPTIQIQKI